MSKNMLNMKLNSKKKLTMVFGLKIQDHTSVTWIQILNPHLQDAEISIHLRITTNHMLELPKLTKLLKSRTPEN
jgi:hypothetical protein